MPGFAWCCFLQVSLLLQSDPDLGTRVKHEVERFKADDPDERAQAAKNIVLLGAKALPLLEPYLKAEDLELKNQVRAAIERIYETDALYLVRRPKRLISVTLKDAPRSRAVEELFRPFNVRPQVRSKDLVSRDPEALINLKVEGATFWQACQALAKSTGTEIDFESFDELVFSPPSGSGRPASFTRDNCLIIGKAVRVEDKVRLTVHGHLERGWLLPSAKLTIDALEGSDGKSYEGAFVQPERKQDDSRTAWSSFTPVVRIASKEGLASGVTLTVRGTLLLELPTQVEAVEIRPEALKLPASYTVSGSTILLKKLRVGEEGYSYSLGHEGPKAWKAPAGQSFLDGFQIIMANQRGPLVHVGTCGYAGSASMSISSGWSSRLAWWQPPTRFCLVRILEVEQVTLPYELRGIEITESEEK
jgi:hypothetical protein